jgi:TonB-dependent receptor
MSEAQASRNTNFLRNKNMTSKAVFKKRILAMAVATSSSIAMADGSLLGTIETKEGGRTLANASVEIPELSRTTVSASDGSFRFDSLPSGDYTLRVSYLGASTAEQALSIRDQATTRKNIALSGFFGEEVLVVGQAGGAASALNRQRNANNIVSAVDADAIGQLSDANVTEALNRLTGVSIDYDQGEGRFVRIRGAGSDLNTVSINGVPVPSPEAGSRAVALDVIPSDLVQSLEVSKTATPDQDANALGGNIEIRSLSAFDRDNNVISVSVEGNYNEQAEEIAPKYALSASTRLLDDKLGLATALSYENRKMVTQNVETDGAWQVPDADDFPTAPQIRMPPEVEQRYYEVERERIGAALNIDLRPSDNSSLYLRTLYSDFEDNETRQKVEWKFKKADSIDQLTETGGTVSDGFRMERELKVRDEQQTIFSTTLGGDWQLDSWLVEASYGFSKAEEKEPGRYDAVMKSDFADATSASWAGTRQPRLSGDAELYNPLAFELDEIVLLDGLSTDEQNQFKLDTTFESAMFGADSRIKFGAKVTDRDKRYVATSDVWSDLDSAPSGDNFLMGQFSYFGGSEGPAVSRPAIDGFMGSAQEGVDYSVDQVGSIEETFAPQYSIDEQALAAYIMQTLDYDNLSFIYGVRYQAVDTDLKGFSVDIDAGSDAANVTPIRYSVTENFLLPSLHLRWEVSDHWQTRGAITQSAVRPTFGQMSPGRLIQREDFNGADFDTNEAEFGNPELKATESTNLDWTLEYYNSEALGSFSIGVFYKDVSDFVYEADFAGTGDWLDYDEAVSFANGDTAHILGAEVSYLTRFDNGFLLQANATITDSEAEYATRKSTSIPGQSDLSANLILGWENEHVSLRLATAYKSESLMALDIDDPMKDSYQDGQTNVDASIRTHFGDFEVSFDAINLTNQSFYAYTGSSNYNLQYEEYGRSYRLGVKWHNF